MDGANFWQVLKKLGPLLAASAAAENLIVYWETGRIGAASYGSLAIILILFVVVAFLVSNSENLRGADSRKLKAVIDLTSLILISVFLSCPWWLYLSVGMNAQISGGIRNWPLPLSIFLITGLPSVLGLTWLSFRHLPRLKERHPRLHRIRNVTIGAILVLIVFVPMVLGKVG